jgi:hypothetical protein
VKRNYQLLTENIRHRSNPDNLSIVKAFSDELSALSYSDVLVYVRTAMKGVDPEYTKKSREAGERVKDHLSPLDNVTFRYQGSVMTNTHIKGHSDIDLLVISEKFYRWDSSNVNRYLNESSIRSRLPLGQIRKLENEVNATPYQGNTLDDLLGLRKDSEIILGSVYEDCNTSNAKAIKIKNKNLKRDVDIVIANWYDDISSILNDKGENRGIQVYNKTFHRREDADFPFLSIQRINERGELTKGRLKKMIRFIKNIKAEAEINLSSFDINAICYDIDVDKYQNATFVELVPVIYNQMKKICTNQVYADSLLSVDGREYIFKGKQDKIEQLQKVLQEVDSIMSDLKTMVY